MGQAIYTKAEREALERQNPKPVKAVVPIHEIANLWPPMADDEWPEFVEDVRANGLLDAITMWRGAIVDGKHRYKACLETGIAPRFDSLNEDWDEWKVATHCQSKHRRRNLTQSQRAAIAAEAIRKYARPIGRPSRVEELPPAGGTLGTAARHAAKDMGSSERSVERAVFVRDNAPEVHDLVKAGKMSLKQGERLAKEPDANKRAAKLKQLDTVTRSDNDGDSWGTPPEWIALARAVMGDIDLDPASNRDAQKVVVAKKYFTKDDDGLTKKWGGRVWMNPPYSQPLVTQFAEKLVAEIESGEVDQACVLVNNATDTKFLQLMLSRCSAALFPRGRVPFLVPESGEQLTGTRQGQVFLYFGENVDRFIEIAGKAGWVGVSP